MPEKLFQPEARTHLDFRIPGAKPIIVSISGKESFLPAKHQTKDFKSQIREDAVSILKRIRDSEHTATNVDYFATADRVKENKFLNAGFTTYVISPVDSEDKFSEGLFDCTGLIVVGVDKKTGKNISFASHADPKTFLGPVKEEFEKHLRERLNEIKKLCLEKSIDAVVVGGLYRDYKEDYLKTVGGHYSQRTYQQNYLDSIKMFGDFSREILGFEPVVAGGPKIVGGDSYFFENDTRRLLLSRPAINHKGADFTPSEFPQVKNKYGKKPKGV